jgi:hypothetical protein
MWFIWGHTYDLRPFLNKHPGGALVLRQCQGMECTALFESYHAVSDREKVKRVMAFYQVASCSQVQKLDFSLSQVEKAAECEDREILVNYPFEKMLHSNEGPTPSTAEGGATPVPRTPMTPEEKAVNVKACAAIQKANSGDALPTTPLLEEGTNQYQLTGSTPWYDRARDIVWNDFKSRGVSSKAPPALLLYHFLWVLAVPVCLYQTYIRGSLLFACLSGVSFWYGPCDLLHTGTHCALLDKRPLLGSLLGYLCGFYHHLPAAWVRQHMLGHHIDTNLHDDPDLHHFELSWRVATWEAWSRTSGTGKPGCQSSRACQA